MIGYLQRHWRGEAGLARSVWLHLVAVNVALAGALALASSQGVFAALGERADIDRLVLGLGAGLGAVALLGLWQIVGAWRAAARALREPRASLLTGLGAWATRGLLVVLLLSLLPVLPRLTAAGTELGRIAFGLDDAAAFELTAVDSELTLTGFVNDRSARELGNFLTYNPTLTLLSLDSPGGRIGPALRAARAIAARGLDTFVERSCASACTLLFLAGESRVLDARGRLGFHRARPLPGLGPSGTADDAMTRFMAERGVAPAFVARIADVPPDRLWYPTLEELFEARVITHVFDGEGLLTEEEWRASPARDSRPASALPENAQP